MRTESTTPPPTIENGARAAGARKLAVSRRVVRPNRCEAPSHVPAPPAAEMCASPTPRAMSEAHLEATSGPAWRPASETGVRQFGGMVYSGRFASYTLASLLRLEGADPEQVAELDQAMVDLGFSHLGDLHTSCTAGAVFRVYGQPESSVYAILLKSGPRGGYEPELYTAFADGASLTTSIACRSGLSQDRKRKTLRYGAEGTVAERYSAHIEKVWELSELHGDARPAEPRLAAFAEALDDLLLRVRE